MFDALSNSYTRCVSFCRFSMYTIVGFNFAGLNSASPAVRSFPDCN